MPVPPAPPPDAAIVTRLRAAGCVFAEDEARLLVSEARTPAELAAMVDRRAAGQPLEHVLGWADFCGLRIAVDPGVFVPRRRTEFLVRQALAIAPPRPVIVDLCCGSGAVGAALAAALDAAELHAADISSRASSSANTHPAARSLVTMAGSGSGAGGTTMGEVSAGRSGARTGRPSGPSAGAACARAPGPRG